MSIESLYAGPVGDAHFARVQSMTFPRAPFWDSILAETKAISVLEVGSGVGVNARFLAPLTHYTGIDISTTALRETRSSTPRVARCSASFLPFKAFSFDLVISAGLAMHQQENTIRRVFQEMAATSRRYVLLCEYEDTHRREIPWHGQRDVLFADTFGLKFWAANPHYRPIWRRNLRKADGFAQTVASLWKRENTS